MTYLRRLPRFEFVSPASVAEVCELAAQAADGEVMLLAGGTDAILQMRRRERTPRQVVGLKALRELDFVREQADGSLALGAMTTLQTLLTSPLVKKHYDVLAETAGQIGGPELRNVATIGGNVAGALPCADMPPALMTLGARVKLASKGGERWVPLDEFFPEFGRTVAAKGELVTEIALPKAPPLSAGCYFKYHDRHSMDMTVVGVAAFVALEADARTIRELRLAYANSAPTVVRARAAEGVLKGKALTEAGLAATAEAAVHACSPRTSWRANREYREELIRNLTRRAIRQATQKAAARKGAQP